MTQRCRLPGHAGEPLRFRFDGVDYTGQAGDTLAAALLANGVRRVSTSIGAGRPRGIVTAGSEEPCAVIQIDAPFPEPMRTATTVELYDGFAGSSLRGQGRLAIEPDPARYDAVNAHCDVLVVGAGPAGLAAAVDAARAGQRVIVADEQPAFGGSLLAQRSADARVDRAVAELSAQPDVTLLRRSTVFGCYDDNFAVAVERRTAHLGAAAPEHVARERLWRIRAQRIVLATGAHERTIAFAGNDIPGVMHAGAARTYVNRYGVLPGRRAVIFTTNDSAYAAARDLAAAGVEIAAVVDVRDDALCCGRIPLLDGRVVVAARGTGQVTAVEVAPRDGGRSATIEADLLLVSGGWSPAVHLFSQGGGTLRWDGEIGAFRPDATRQRVEVVGAANGDGLDAAEPLWVVPSPDGDYRTHFVDLQRDVTVADLRRATGAGLRSVEHVKRYTTAGTAHDQGKTTGALASAVVADALGRQLAELGTTTFRGPYTPVGFAALAGRNRGDLLEPERVTSIHDWHVAHGALFENVGQWKRPWYYPHDGEDLDAAVLRECRATRERVGFMDGSTLGKVDLQGPDAGAFLDLLYTNLISSLKVGAIRYGVMCHPDGMVFDDGTVARIAEDRFLVTTTTGNAAAVLDWMEEWHQTEWPHLSVYCTSVTEQWATVAVVGPASRDVLAALAPGLAVDNDAFPFMTWRDTAVSGLSARVCRISFSGELAYEINVSWWDGLALWEAVAAAGAPYGITPYGTETMHVLRAEKGYPIIGQDTDGTVTPHDLGMIWAVSKKKPDFLGKRSFARADNQRPDRKHLVGLLPEDPACRLREGTHLVAFDRLPEPPVPTLGHVTSSYRSAALDRTFALALVKGGRDRIGERVYASVGADLIPVQVTSSVLFDPEGARRDG